MHKLAAFILGESQNYCNILKNEAIGAGEIARCYEHLLEEDLDLISRTHPHLEIHDCL